MMVWMLIGATPWQAVKDVRVRDAKNLRPLSVSERVELGGLVRRMVEQAPLGRFDDTLRPSVESLGWVWTESDHQVRIAHPAGGGLMVLRLGPADPWVVTAPHPWFDLGTGRLTSQVFEESRARAAVFATAQRNVGSGTDAAHTIDGGVHALTLALTDALHRPAVVQLHGFGSGHTGADLVLGGWGADALGVNLGRELGWVVAFGDAVPSLAGRTNKQVRALQGRVPVAHLELSKATRDDLRRPERRALLVQQLEAWAP